MIIRIDTTKDLRLEVGTGRLVVLTHADNRRAPVTSAKQVLALLSSADAALTARILDNLRATAEIALDRDSEVGIKATKHTRENWRTTLGIVREAMATEQAREVA
jgi:hypothetical protein